MHCGNPSEFPPHILTPNAPDEPDPATQAELRAAFHRKAPRTPSLHPDYLKALNLDDDVGRRCAATLTQTLALLLERGKRVEIQTFGAFALQPFRLASAGGNLCGGRVEAPPMSPIHFDPSALLLRWIELGERREGDLPRCDVLFTALREQTDLPRAGIPQIILGTFLEISDILISRRSVQLEGLGQILVRRSVFSFSIDPATCTLSDIRPRHALRFRIDPALAKRLREKHRGGLIPAQSPPRPKGERR